MLTKPHRVDGALGPWLEQLSTVLLDIFPLPEGEAQESLDTLPPARVAVVNADKEAQTTQKDPLVADREYYTAILSCNRRITAEEWYQDVRHFEFKFDEDVQ